MRFLDSMSNVGLAGLRGVWMILALTIRNKAKNGKAKRDTRMRVELEGDTCLDETS